MRQVEIDGWRTCHSGKISDGAGAMTIFDRLERRFGWISFPGFLRYYAILHALVFAIQMLRPEMGQMFEFDRAKIFSGEVWRVFTMFFASSEFGRPGFLTIIFLFFAVNFAFMISDGIEGAWGEFKTSIFFYLGILMILVANFIYPYPLVRSSFALYASAFFVFATLFPKMEIRLFLFLPIQVRFLGIFQAVLLLLLVLGSPGLIPFVVMAFANYLIFAGIPALKGRAMMMESAGRRKNFKAAQTLAGEAFNTCDVCKKTDVGNPELEFRVANDGKEYCMEHLPE